MLKYADALPTASTEKKIEAPLGTNGKPLDLSRVHEDLRPFVRNQKTYDIARRYNPVVDAPKKPEPPQYQPSGPYPGRGAQNAYDRFQNPTNYDSQGNAKYDVVPGAYRANEHATPENLEIARVQNQALKDAIHDRSLALGQGIWNGTNIAAQGAGGLLRGAGNIASYANRAYWWPTAKLVEATTGYDHNKMLNYLDIGHRLSDKAISGAQAKVNEWNGAVQDNYEYAGNPDDQRDMYITGTAIPIVMATAYGSRVPGAGRLVSPVKAKDVATIANAGAKIAPRVGNLITKAAPGAAGAVNTAGKVTNGLAKYYNWLAGGSNLAKVTTAASNAATRGLPLLDLATGWSRDNELLQDAYKGLSTLGSVANPAALANYGATHSEAYREPVLEAIGNTAGNNARLFFDKDRGALGSVADSTASAVNKYAPGAFNKAMEWMIEPTDVKLSELADLGIDALGDARLRDLKNKDYMRVTRDALNAAPYDPLLGMTGLQDGTFTNAIHNYLSQYKPSDMKDPLVRGLRSAVEASDTAGDYLIGTKNKQVAANAQNMYKQIQDARQYLSPEEAAKRSEEILKANVPDLAAQFLGEQYRDQANAALDNVFKNGESLYEKWQSLEPWKQKYILWGLNNARRGINSWWMNRHNVPVDPQLDPNAVQQQIQPQN